ncbi:hypothetical protein CVT25_000665 [Psilocybe cyanescens]|uniref:High nitrogen upregulated cytochrome P450 monooxygenase 2 n=1 Tax=Psilocybe cyanescens TaxID=93625 RepID=A0A409WZI7_PSICY|nr:hypothetical protein CVT25_000665 [Psilocybe cyanescens]
MTSFERILLFVMVVAVLAHLWLRKNQPKSLVWMSGSLFALVLFLSAFLVPHVQSHSWAFMLTSSVFTATLLGSIMLYRLSPLHPLANYPGPFLCKVSKLWGAWIAWNGKPHVYYKSLHDKYGSIVRIGPNELSIIDADMIPNILGSSGMPKGPMWEGRRLLPSKNFNRNNSLTSVRDFRRHAELRKPWDAAFKPTAMLNYEGMLTARAEQLVDKLKELSRSESFGNIDMALWLNYFTFGGVYSLMRDGDIDQVLLKMKRGVFLPSVSQHIPWLLGALRAIPLVGSDARAYGKFGVEQAKKRAALDDSILRKDLFYYLLESEPAETKASKIVSSALLAIVAGSDTTSSVFANLFYFLLREPDYYRRLRAEIDVIHSPSDSNDTIDINSLANLPFLNAVINETLRLQPPILTGLQRSPVTGSGGKFLSADMFIPEGTAVLVSPYILHRCPRYFAPDPDRFWPDRWLSQDPNVVVDRSAYIPFSTGPANCPGKPLAMVELRYVTCLIVRTFDMSFSEGFDHGEWEKSLVDRFIMLKGELPVRLTVREVC